MNSQATQEQATVLKHRTEALMSPKRKHYTAAPTHKGGVNKATAQLILKMANSTQLAKTNQPTNQGLPQAYEPPRRPWKIQVCGRTGWVAQGRRTQ